MRNFLAFLLAVLCSSSQLASAAGPPITGKKIVGYFAEWGVYQRNYFVTEIPAEKLNVINYAFANLTADGDVVLYDSYAATELAYPGDTWDQPLRGNFNQLKKLKKKYPHLVTMISVGGWTLSDHFSDVARTTAGRTRFAKSAVAFMKKYGFDGVDIDWEYPGGGGLSPGRPQDKQNFTLLLKALRQELDAAGTKADRTYYLTIAAPAGQDKIANLDILQVARQCDWINIMTYDLHGAWENQTNHHAALYSNDKLSCDAAVTTYLSKGAPANKVVLGIPFYGRAWKNVGAKNHGVLQPASGAPMGTWEEGMFDYHDIASKLKTAPTTYLRYYDEKRVAPWIYAPSLDNGILISYEDELSIATKMRYIKEKKLGGAMFWELSGDTEQSTLLQAIFKGLK